MDVADKYLKTLRGINSIARSRALYHGNSSAQSSTSPSTTSLQKIPELHLPPPNDLTQRLLEAGCASVISANAYNQAFCSRITALQSKYRKDHKEKMQTHLNSKPQTYSSICKLTSAVENQYLREECTPILEQYFASNAYPSPDDRSILARKTQMTIRQIEVWFQNRRNRSRKDGKIPQRNPQSQAPNPVAQLKQRENIPVSTVSEALTRTARGKSPSPTRIPPETHTTMQPAPSSSPVDQHPLICDKSPSYAFPTRYQPKTYDHDPFPVKSSNYKFPPPIWPRKPTAKIAQGTLRKVKNQDIEQLCKDMSTKLHLRCTSKKVEEDCNTTPWFSATVTIVPGAPHFALARGQSRPLKRKDVPNDQPCSSSSSAPVVESTTLSPEPPRKIAKLSTRSPHRQTREGAPKSTRESTPSRSRSSSGSSPTPSLRSRSSSSSLSSSPSSTFSQRRLSSSSASSVSSSTLTTPNSEPVELPADGSGCSAVEDLLLSDAELDDGSVRLDHRRYLVSTRWTPES